MKNSIEITFKFGDIELKRKVEFRNDGDFSREWNDMQHHVVTIMFAQIINELKKDKNKHLC